MLPAKSLLPGFLALDFLQILDFVESFAKPTNSLLNFGFDSGFDGRSEGRGHAEERQIIIKHPKSRHWM